MTAPAPVLWCGAYKDSRLTVCGRLLTKDRAEEWSPRYVPTCSRHQGIQVSRATCHGCNAEFQPVSVSFSEYCYGCFDGKLPCYLIELPPELLCMTLEIVLEIYEPEFVRPSRKVVRDFGNLRAVSREIRERTIYVFVERRVVQFNIRSGDILLHDGNKKFVQNFMDSWMFKHVVRMEVNLTGTLPVQGNFKALSRLGSKIKHKLQRVTIRFQPTSFITSALYKAIGNPSDPSKAAVLLEMLTVHLKRIRTAELEILVNDDDKDSRMCEYIGFLESTMKTVEGS